MGAALGNSQKFVEFQSIKMQKDIFNSVQYTLSINQANIIYLLISGLTLKLVIELMRSYDEKRDEVSWHKQRPIKRSSKPFMIRRGQFEVPLPDIMH